MKRTYIYFLLTLLLLSLNLELLHAYKQLGSKPVLHLDFETENMQDSVESLQRSTKCKIEYGESLRLQSELMDGRLVFRGDCNTPAKLTFPIAKKMRKGGRLKIRYGSEVSAAAIQITAMSKGVELFNIACGAGEIKVTGISFPFSDMIAEEKVLLKPYDNFGEVVLEWKNKNAMFLSFSQPDSLMNGDDLLIDKEDVGGFLEPGVIDTITIEGLHKNHPARVIYLYDVLLEG